VPKGEATRQDIIRKAAPIFNQKGYSGAALSDLMRATGLEKGGIYRHFESKEELAGDAFDHAWKVAMDARFEGTEEIPNTVNRLKQIVRNDSRRLHHLLLIACCNLLVMETRGCRSVVLPLENRVGLNAGTSMISKSQEDAGSHDLATCSLDTKTDGFLVYVKSDIVKSAHRVLPVSFLSRRFLRRSQHRRLM
jgi:AcrR family transcriptional regulator